VDILPKCGYGESNPGPLHGKQGFYL